MNIRLVGLSILSIFIIVPLSKLAAQEPFDQNFSPDITAPDGFRSNRTSYSAIMDVLEPSVTEVTEEQLQRTPWTYASKSSGDGNGDCSTEAS